MVDTITVGNGPLGISITPAKPKLPKVRITNKTITAIVIDKGCN
ncbi:hypothetical protein [Tepidibacter aestuarii]|nr:hypothetical protein [Tepidibacter aestuarii]CAH2213191.1 protein of unknown function [Tepidibacter aestuarii]